MSWVYSIHYTDAARCYCLVMIRPALIDGRLTVVSSVMTYGHIYHTVIGECLGLSVTFITLPLGNVWDFRSHLSHCHWGMYGAYGHIYHTVIGKCVGITVTFITLIEECVGLTVYGSWTPIPRAAPRHDDWGDEDHLKSVLSMHRP